MTDRRERRVFWFFIFWCGLVLAALPILLPALRYPVLNLSVGVVLMAAAVWRLWMVRRRARREPWSSED